MCIDEFADAITMALALTAIAANEARTGDGVTPFWASSVAFAKPMQRAQSIRILSGIGALH